jgi:hypothetical protein
MKNYDFPSQFRVLYDQAVELYSKGRRGADSFFDKAQTAWLASHGLTAQYLYDYAEDENNDREPGFGHALTIEAQRRSYFVNVQGGRPSSTVLDEAKLPAKSEQAKGIEWLPRIIPKAKAKLKGELPASLMYCCGGDRRFFKTHDILPAEFLGVIWRNGDDDAATVAWVAARSRAAK